MYKILIAEDDKIIAQAIKTHMESWGCQAYCAERFEDLLAEFATYEPQLVLMDVSLPYYNGYYWCAEIRKVSKVPIIFISSAADNMNIVLAMNMGGDDFITKPFDLSVLTAKVQAMLRRTYDFAGQSDLLESHGAVLNLGSATLTYRGKRIDLSKNEFKILHILMENRGQAVAREAIMARLWETDCFIDDNTLTVNIARLRKKLEDAGLQHFIVTRKGLGYMVEA